MILAPNRRYEVELIEQDGSRSFVRGVLNAIDGNLLALQVDGHERIFNTASSVFVSVREWKIPDGSIYQPIKPPGA